jgi:hypothetical protein
MSDYATVEEVRAWYQGRGIPVPSQLSKRHIAGWDKAHPDRPYLARQHGSASTYRDWGCRCDECRAAVTRRDRNLRDAAEFDAS